MGQPAAKQGDRMIALDTHMIQPPGASPPVPVPHPFSGVLDTNLSVDVNIEGMPAATVGSVATNSPPHLPQGGTFVTPPSNRGDVIMGSATVFINGKPAARNLDKGTTCGDPPVPGAATVVAVSTVFIGG